MPLSAVRAPVPPQETSSVFGVAGRPRMVALSALEPDLFPGPGPAARLLELDAGRWAPERPAGGGQPLGLLVVDGMIARTAAMDDEVTAELVGPGDLIRAGETWPDDEDALIPCRAGWEVLQPARVAVLGRSVGGAVAGQPELLPALLERAVRRSRSQAVFLAIANTKRIDVRLLVLLWHMAERWGRVTRDGVVVPLDVTHRRLGSLVGARRPTVTAALTRLSARGIVLRTPDRGFVLTDGARAEVAQVCRGGARGAPCLSAA